jgi:TonB family protein
VTPAAPTPTAPTPDRLVQDIQTALNQKGFNAGPADGFIGPQTQAAIIAAQRALGVTANGQPSEALLTALRTTSVVQSANYSQILRSCIFPNVPNNLIVDSPGPGPSTRVTIRLQTYTGNATSIDLVESSGNQGFDQSVLAGVRRCVPFPRPFGGYPETIHIRYGL